jgi:LysR family nitrogen assimilation transcriptional regulator
LTLSNIEITVDLRQLEYFVRIVQLGGFNRAAAQLHIAQSALSRKMQLLEHELGVSLLIRGRQGVQLTPAGELLFRRSESLLQDFQRVRDEVLAESDEPRGELSIGLPPSLTEMVTLPLLRRFRTDYPAVRVKTAVGVSVQLRYLLVTRKVDLAVYGVGEPDYALDTQQLFRDEVFLVGPPDAHFAGMDSISWADVAELPLILTYRPNSIRVMIEAAAAKAGVTLDVRTESDDVPLLIDLAREGIGYTMLPYSALHHHLIANRIAAVKLSNLRYTWVIASSRETPLSAAGRKAKELIAEIATARITSQGWPNATTLADAGK